MNESRTNKVPYENYIEARAHNTPGMTLGISWKARTLRIRQMTAGMLTWKSEAACSAPSRMPETDKSRLLTLKDDMYLSNPIKRF